MLRGSSRGSLLPRSRLKVRRQHRRPIKVADRPTMKAVERAQFDGSHLSLVWQCLQEDTGGMLAVVEASVGNPDVALLDPVDQGLRIKFVKPRRNLKQFRRLRFVPNMLGRDNRAVLGFDPQRESALAVDPA